MLSHVRNFLKVPIKILAICTDGSQVASCHKNIKNDPTDLKSVMHDYFFFIITSFVLYVYVFFVSQRLW